MKSRARCVLALVAFTACGPRGSSEPLTVFAAGSLAKPLREALDSSGIAYRLETAGSLELARRVSDLGRTPDVIALADEEVFAQLLLPAHLTWYATFATNHLVIARSPSVPADTLRADNWVPTLLARGVETGRADPDLDPAGYRTLLAFQLAERAAAPARPGLARQLQQAAPLRNVRPKSADLVALLQAGALDYAWLYESVARSAGLTFVSPGPRIDLGSEADSAWYAAAAVTVRGRGTDSVTIHGRPIRYALAIPTRAANAADALRLARYLLGPASRRVMQRNHLPVVQRVTFTGDGVPDPLRVAGDSASPNPVP